MNDKKIIEKIVRELQTKLIFPESYITDNIILQFLSYLGYSYENTKMYRFKNFHWESNFGFVINQKDLQIPIFVYDLDRNADKNKDFAKEDRLSRKCEEYQKENNLDLFYYIETNGLCYRFYVYKNNKYTFLKGVYLDKLTSSNVEYLKLFSVENTMIKDKFEENMTLFEFKNSVSECVPKLIEGLQNVFKEDCIESLITSEEIGNLLIKYIKNKKAKYIKNKKKQENIENSNQFLDIEDIDEENNKNIVSTNTIFHIKSRKLGVDARAMYNIGGLVLLSGSVISKSITPSSPKFIKNWREKYKDSIDENMVILKDITFRRPSGAASFVLGHSAHGRSLWATEEGITFDEFESAEGLRQSLDKVNKGNDVQDEEDSDAQDEEDSEYINGDNNLNKGKEDIQTLSELQQNFDKLYEEIEYCQILKGDYDFCDLTLRGKNWNKFLCNVLNYMYREDPEGYKQAIEDLFIVDDINRELIVDVSQKKREYFLRNGYSLYMPFVSKDSYFESLNLIVKILKHSVNTERNFKLCLLDGSTIFVVEG